MSIFPCHWRRQLVWKPVKKCSGNCWTAANYTWYEKNCLKSKPLKGPPKPLKSLCRPKNRLPKANVAVYPTEAAHDQPVSEDSARDLHRPMKYWGQRCVCGPDKALNMERRGIDKDDENDWERRAQALALSIIDNLSAGSGHKRLIAGC